MQTQQGLCEPNIDLVSEAQAGSASAFTALVNQHDRRIYRISLNILGNPQDAEDVLQETFLKAFSRLDTFRGESTFYTWLARIAINEALMSLRRHEHFTWLDEPVDTEEGSRPRELIEWDDNPEQRYQKAELERILNQCMERVPPALRVVVVMRDVGNLSTEETAQLLGLSKAAVKSRLLRGRLRLRELLNPYFKRA